MKKNISNLKQEIKNDEKKIDTIISTTMLLGSLSFLIVGISSYFKVELIGFLNAKDILFFPQGLTMCFYGIAGILISSYQVRNLKYIRE
jgi:hypothetical protein